jgi:anthranilate phosphoribosyltransferase
MQHPEGKGTPVLYLGRTVLNTLNADLNPIRHLLALLGVYHILHVSKIRVNSKYHDLYT